MPQETSITQQLRTDLGGSFGGNDSHATGVVKQAYEIPLLQLTAKGLKSK